MSARSLEEQRRLIERRMAEERARVDDAFNTIEEFTPGRARNADNRGSGRSSGHASRTAAAGGASSARGSGRTSSRPPYRSVGERISDDWHNTPVHGRFPRAGPYSRSSFVNTPLSTADELLNGSAFLSAARRRSFVANYGSPLGQSFSTGYSTMQYFATLLLPFPLPRSPESPNYIISSLLCSAVSTSTSFRSETKEASKMTESCVEHVSCYR